MINVNERRRLEYNQNENHDECWKISHKYSSNLIRNINSRDIYNICCSIYGQYLTELKSKNLQLKDKQHNIKNYIQIWDTMVNTVRKGEVETQAVRLLHQTNCQHSA
jgi:hypothetical protein